MSDRLSTEQRVVDEPGSKVLEDRFTQRGQDTLDSERISAQAMAVDVDRLMRNRFSYNDWLVQKFNSLSEISLAEEHYERFQLVMEESHLEQLKMDIRMLNTIVSKIDEDIHRVRSENRVLTHEEIDQILDHILVGDQAKSVLIHVNNTLDTALKSRLLGRIRLYSSLRLRRLSNRLQERLEPLVVLLEAARQERKKAWIKGVLNASVTITILVFPKLGLLARSGIYISQTIMNAMIGGEQDAMMAATGGFTGLHSKIVELEDALHSKQSIARTVNRNVTVTGFAFDVKDVLAGHQNVEEIQALMEEALEASQYLLADIVRAKQFLERVKEEWQHVRAELISKDIDVASARAELKSRMNEVNYMP